MVSIVCAAKSPAENGHRVEIARDWQNKIQASSILTGRFYTATGNRRYPLDRVLRCPELELGGSHEPGCTKLYDISTGSRFFQPDELTGASYDVDYWRRLPFEAAASRHRGSMLWSSRVCCASPWISCVNQFKLPMEYKALRVSRPLLCSRGRPRQSCCYGATVKLLDDVGSSPRSIYNSTEYVA